MLASRRIAGGNAVKKLLFAAVLMLPAVAALAQPPAGGQAVVVTAEQVTALAQRARQGYAAAATKNPNLHETIIQSAPYTLSLEHRVGKANAAQHAIQAELMIVLEGSGRFTSGGAIANATVTGNNTSGPDIVGGTSRTVSKGDMMLVPEGVPHQFLPDSGGPLIMATMLVPRTGAWGPPAPGGRGGAPRLFTGGSELPVMIDNAGKALSGSTRFFTGEALLALPPYRVGLEYWSPRRLSAVHDGGELMLVLDGEGTIVTEGRIVNPRQSGADTLGDDIAEGKSQKLKKGDFVYVPKGVAHMAVADSGRFALAALHLP
jgi:mannose-6-phosphate isomerase-like protein (cupin superfamily)